MFGHGSGRQHRSRWAILSFLFALAFVWSYTIMGDQSGGSWTLLRVGLAVGLGICLLRLMVMFVSSRRLRHAEEGDAWQPEAATREAEGPQAEDPTDKRSTYEEVFGVNLNIDEDSIAIAAEDEEMEAEAEPSVEEFPVEEHVEEPATTADEGVQPDFGGAVEHVDADVEPVEASSVDGDTQDALQKMREEFAARAKEAELRVKQREGEPDEAASAPKSKP
jgi:hypothetical protein